MQYQEIPVSDKFSKLGFLKVKAIKDLTIDEKASMALDLSEEAFAVVSRKVGEDDALSYFKEDIKDIGDSSIDVHAKMEEVLARITFRTSVHIYYQMPIDRLGELTSDLNWMAEFLPEEDLPAIHNVHSAIEEYYIARGYF